MCTMTSFQWTTRHASIASVSNALAKPVSPTLHANGEQERGERWLARVCVQAYQSSCRKTRGGSPWRAVGVERKL
jgi:hypothetical protein